MMCDGEIEQVAHHRFYLLDARVAEFHHFFAVNAQDVVVLFVAVTLFVLRLIFAKLMFFN